MRTTADRADHLHRVLEHAGGNIEAAAEYLLSREAAMGGAGAATAASNSDPDAGANQPLALTESARPHCALHRPHAPSRAEMDEYLLSREAAMGGAGAATAASTSDADEGALSRTACAPSADVFTVAISVYCHRHASGAGDHAWQGEGGLEGLKIRAIRAFIRVEASTRNSGN